ncbi:MULTISPECIES: RHS repeat-associated core domain-containing protein [Pseudomonas]|nr:MULTISPECIES: RHS repeat-associated core domain-containing protein [Pseudomonas]MCA5967953.1 RHS repeat protein [Pseudomonas sp. P129]MCH5555604.1 RHS repeat protein [Pseudomonas syringae pv. syringae]MCH5576110.1 RHS repeat protein [Pseudomonas syringae pv. syringae]MCH5668205.1 RHS repeat protein [Pseudomonas syringae pv. syringae]MDF5774394.1 RHS repeat-associated core domain-containing protein [Pseudomonas syringae pv. syringae]
MPDSLHRHTPTLMVTDSRGLPIRSVSYYRGTPGDSSQARPERQQYDAAARPVARWDARLFRQLTTEPFTRPNLSTVFSLTGAPLAVNSVDAGCRVSLYGEAGQLLEHHDARGTHWTTRYDELLRPLAINEKPRGQPCRTSERFSYADSSELAAANNVCGHLIQTYDGSGSDLIDACGVSGQILQQTRRFLQKNDLPNWPEDALHQDELLEPGPGFSSKARFNAMGEVLDQTDASGNRHTSTYDVSGQLKATRLRVMNGSDQVLLHGLMYDAHGRIESQTAGNGVISCASFDPADGRMGELITYRPGVKQLQHLLYDYDPVGNVTRIRDEAQPARHCSGQRIDAVNEYEYDSLYQLIRASGRETALAGIRPELPELARLPVDESQLLNYTQRYSYDDAGNLLKLIHKGAQAYTRHMIVDTKSNRALPWSEGNAPPDFDKQFDANGNQQALVAGRALHWDSGNRLIKVDAVTRSEQPEDGEHYAYDASGQRMRKTAKAMTRTFQHQCDVRYLPGLEIRTNSATGERLEVITVYAGRTNVRCLHWLEGKPDAIDNNQLRYSIGDHLGSSTLELDAQAKLISHEGYYPFGGTAWWAARSAVEASYKVIRYSGKERDSTGLYYYGVRYYAPWLMRWMSADPLGDVEGLNLYRMTRNNPVSRVDPEGGQSIDFDGMTLISIGITIGVVAMGLTTWALLAYTSWTRKNARLKDYRAFSDSAASEFGLDSNEIKELHGFMSSVNARPRDIFFRHDDPTGSVHAYYLPKSVQQDFFKKHSKSPEFLSQSTKLIHMELRAAEYPDLSRRASNVSNVSTLSNVSNRTSITETSEPTVSPEDKKRYRDSAGTSTSTPEAPSLNAPVKKKRATTFAKVAIGDFFNSTVFEDAKNTFGEDEVTSAVTKAIDSFNERGFNGASAHKLRTGEISLDLLGLGGATGRGRMRLLLAKNKKTGRLYPTRITDTHR